VAVTTTFKTGNDLQKFLNAISLYVASETNRIVRLFTFRVVLLIWDALTCIAHSGATGQHVQEFSQVKSLLTVLTLLLKGFEVATINVLYCMIMLTAAGSLKTTFRLRSDWDGFAR